MIIKFCYYYQIKNKVSQQFKFMLKKNIDFNHEIIIYIIYLNQKSRFYTINTAIIF